MEIGIEGMTSLIYIKLELKFQRVTTGIRPTDSGRIISIRKFPQIYFVTS